MQRGGKRRREYGSCSSLEAAIQRTHCPKRFPCSVFRNCIQHNIHSDCCVFYICICETLTTKAKVMLHNIKSSETHVFSTKLPFQWRFVQVLTSFISSFLFVQLQLEISIPAPKNILCFIFYSPKYFRAFSPKLALLWILRLNCNLRPAKCLRVQWGGKSKEIPCSKVTELALASIFFAYLKLSWSLVGPHSNLIYSVIYCLR